VLNLHILQIIEQWFPQIGGSEIHCLNLSKHLVKNGHKVTLIVRDIINNKTRFQKKVNYYNGNLKIYRVGIPSKFQNNIGRLLFIPFSLYYTFKLKHVDLIHCHTFTGGISGRLLTIFKKPVVLTVHTYHSKYWFSFQSFLKGLFYYTIEKLLFLYNSFNYMIVISRKICNQLIKKGISQDKFTFISNGVDLLQFDKVQITNSNSYILFIGRLEKVKGIFYLLEAFKNLNKINKEISLKIVGDGKLKNQIIKYIENNRLGDWVDLLGSLTGNNLIEIYKGAKLIVIPSINEGFPLVILEAWASKIPIISTKVGDIPKFLKNNINGILIPPKDPVQILEKIKLLLNNENLCKKITNEGYNLVKNQFSWKKIAKETINVYKKMLK